jgi:curved DNA-binding protein CbpA
MNNNQEGEKEVDYYGLLNVASDASAEQIQKRFRKLSLLTHPDKIASV